MSLFSKDIIEQDTDLQLFHDRVWKWIEEEFPDVYAQYGGDLFRVSSVFNHTLDNPNNRALFAAHGMHHPYFAAIQVFDPESLGKICISILYSEDKFGLCDKTAKTFLHKTLKAPSLFKTYNS